MQPMRSSLAGRRAAAWTGAVAAVVLLAACSSGSNNSATAPSATASNDAPSPSASATPTPTATTPTPPPAPKVSTDPANGASGVNPTAPIRLTVSGGKLSRVALTNAAGTHVSGTLSADRRSWHSTEVLGYGKTYTWSGRAVGTEGTSTPITGRFTTLNPTLMRASINIGDNETVGIGAPIIITFYGHVENKAEVERRLTVHTSPSTAGGWAWLPDDAVGSRLHWRPKAFWKPGTRVSLSAKFYGLDYGGGRYGVEDLTDSFRIGRSQITRGNVNSHRLLVYRNDKLIWNFPASYGVSNDPNRVTRTGVYINMEKYATKYMTYPRYHYFHVPEHWAVRIDNGGEFIHENPETTGVQGINNVTHGCINLNEHNAHAYYESSLYGDPVIITGSSIALSATDGDVYDWTVPWSQWVSMSALH